MTATALPIMTLLKPTGFVHDKREERWELLEEGCQVEGEPALELASFLLEGEDYVNGQVMRARSLEMGGRTGQYHAERMLAQAKSIPTEWRQFYLVFPDTIWRGPDGGLYVPYLDWGDVRWVLDFRYVGRDGGLWYGRYRVVRLRK